MKSKLLTVAMTIPLTAPSYGQTKFDYPELLVSPSALETLEQEAREENNERWLVHAQTQVPAIINLFTGIRAMGEGAPEGEPETRATEINNSGLVAASIGGGWLGVTIGMSLFYSPYRNDYFRVRKLPGKSKREQLIRERRAEESLESAARMAKRLRYIGAVVNFGAAVSVLSATEDQQTRAQGAFALLSCALPLIFDYSWSITYQRHLDYKKKIYSPIVELQMLPEAGVLQPALSLAWRF
ncbi:hypothetical protein [Pseudobacteriovorax antillogorgiicola]|uniref:Uncharacterized protein n=1 Tax=Pseudobacteriovorax antillogorgiicola TaxID=1513793 RepID=A0A1Y6CFM2_9BACT|nr:hypothetical protein [Pseudobacteriovorax antillogorgiicola]TCS51760.1 hypothetical protein EDD56_110145 [Pseudobacteriovorax antillogorgiicola]SMF49764.1 hypothetical protein SAMN06296036_115114 [Pseudobacteriovorax antillogorgiicola]